MNNNQKLLNEIIKMEPLHFTGLAKLLGVELLQEIEGKQAPRNFADVLEDVMRKFNSLGRVRKREILRLVNKSNKG